MIVPADSNFAFSVLVEVGKLRFNENRQVAEITDSEKCNGKTNEIVSEAFTPRPEVKLIHIPFAEDLKESNPYKHYPAISRKKNTD